jgi:hypothetical protein
LLDALERLESLDRRFQIRSRVARHGGKRKCGKRQGVSQKSMVQLPSRRAGSVPNAENEPPGPRRCP